MQAKGAKGNTDNVVNNVGVDALHKALVKASSNVRKRVSYVAPHNFLIREPKLVVETLSEGAK